MSHMIPAAILLMNALAFALMGRDKSLARAGRRRISEKTLFLPVILGGSIGGILGMAVFRHKTRHTRFVLGFPAILLLQLAAVYAYFNM